MFETKCLIFICLLGCMLADRHYFMLFQKLIWMNKGLMPVDCFHNGMSIVTDINDFFQLVRCEIF